MIDDNYSDDIGNEFEEEYLDDDYEEKKAKPQPQIKNDFWDPQQKPSTINTSNQKSTISTVKNNITPVVQKAVIKQAIAPVVQVNNAKPTYQLDEDEEEGDYEDDDFDEDEEDKFKKTAMQFTKQLDTLKAQNEIRKAQVDKLEKNTIQQKQGTYQKPTQDEDDEDYDDDFDQEYEKIVNQQNQKVQPKHTSSVIQPTSKPSLIDPRSKQATMSKNDLKSQQDVQSTPDKSVTAKIQKHIEDRNPYKFIEKTLGEARGKLDKMKGTPQLLETLTDVFIMFVAYFYQNTKKKKFLKSENKQLRDQLKKMSENVNLLIEKMNQETLRKKRLQGGGNSSRPGSQRIKAREKEIQNTDKAIQNLIKEHQRLKKRLEEVQSPDFLLNLKKNIRTTEQEIKNYEKMLQQLHVEQIRREKRLDKIIEKNEPETMKQINDQTSRLAYLNEKIAELREQYDKSEKLKDQQTEHLEELKTRLEKLQQIADHYGIEVDKHDQNNKDYEKLNTDLANLEKQKRIIKSAIDTMTKKFEGAIIDKKKEFDQLYMKKAMILKSYNEKIKMLRIKGQEIQELIEKAKAGADKGLIEILKKYEEANQKIFEKYPEGEEVELSILEAAATELQKAEQSRVYNDTQPDDSGLDSVKKVKKKKKEIDDDMQKYLEELKLKEQDIQAKLQSQQDQERQKRENENQIKQKQQRNEKEEQDKQKRDQQDKKQREEDDKKQRDIEKRLQEQREKLEQEKALQKQREEEEVRQRKQKEDEERLAQEALNKKPNIASKPFSLNRKAQQQNQTNVQQQQSIAQKQEVKNGNDIDDEVQDEVKSDQEDKYQQLIVQSTPQQQESNKKPATFSKPAFMMKPSVKNPSQNDIQNNSQLNNDASRNIGSIPGGSIQNQRGAEQQKPVSFTEKYGIAPTVNNQAQNNVGSFQSNALDINSTIPTLQENGPSRRLIQQPSYVPGAQSRISTEKPVTLVDSGQQNKEPVKRQIVDPFAKYDSYDPLAKLQPAGQSQIEPLANQNQIPIISNNQQQAKIGEIKPLQQQQQKNPWGDPVQSDFKEIPILNNNNLGGAGVQPLNKGLWGDQPLSEPKSFGVNQIGGGLGAAQKQNIWGNQPLEQPKKNLWDDIPQEQPKSINQPTMLGQQQQQPKRSLWDEQPSEFKVQDSNIVKPLNNNNFGGGIAPVNKYDFSSKNDGNQISSLGGAGIGLAGGIGVSDTQNKAQPSNDYLSMIGDRNTRQPRRMAAPGGQPKQDKPKQNIGGGGGGIMSGLDELGDL